MTAGLACPAQVKIAVGQVFLIKQLPDQSNGYFYDHFAALLLQVVFAVGQVFFEKAVA